jgi:hypothetical protein
MRIKIGGTAQIAHGPPILRRLVACGRLPKTVALIEQEVLERHPIPSFLRPSANEVHRIDAERFAAELRPAYRRSRSDEIGAAPAPRAGRGH